LVSSWSGIVIHMSWSARPRSFCSRL